MSEPYTDKHTQGPWHTGHGNGEGSIFSDNGRMRMQHHDHGATVLYPIASMVKGWDDEEDAANANLVAAAPCMFEALRKCECELAMYSQIASNPEAWGEALNAARNAMEAACHVGATLSDVYRQDAIQ